MITATYSDKDLIVTILTQSFFDNKSVNLAVKQDAHTPQRIRRLMEYCFDVSFDFGEVYLSDDKNGCALILFPDKMKTSFRSVWRDIKFVATVTGLLKLKKLLSREATIKQAHPEKPFAHLWYIGVDPRHQHKGTGTRLLLSILEEYKKAGRPVYLETSVPENVTWYKKYGFAVYKELQFDHPLYLLRHLAVKIFENIL